jgi:L-threonylcarbamoyladenylate synthase
MINSKIIRNTELLLNVNAYSKILSEKIFITPTDTIYGLSCNAGSNKLVKKLRKIKKTKQPFSIIVPSKQWILENCEVNELSKKWINKLPGPYTLVLRLKNKKAVPRHVYNKKDKTLGIRIPDHWISQVVSKLGFPIVTTSANISGGNYMTSLDDLNPEIEKKVDLVISVGLKKGNPSKVIRLVEDDEEILRS